MTALGGWLVLDMLGGPARRDADATLTDGGFRVRRSAVITTERLVPQLRRRDLSRRRVMLRGC